MQKRSNTSIVQVKAIDGLLCVSSLLLFNCCFTAVLLLSCDLELLDTVGSQFFGRSQQSDSAGLAELTASYTSSAVSRQ